MEPSRRHARSRRNARGRRSRARCVEETGLTVDVGPIVEVFDRIFRDDDGRVRYHFVLVDYVCDARGGHVSRAGSDVGRRRDRGSRIELERR